MSLLRYMLRQSWPLLLLATLLGAVSGVSSAGVVMLINRGIAEPRAIEQLGLTFLGLCLLLLVSKVGSELSLLRLTQAAIYQLRLDLARKLLATPFEKLQALGKPRLLVILTEDINTFTNAFEWVPILFINGVVVSTCLVYLAWLSWPMLALLATSLIIGLAAFHLAERRPLAHLARVRERKDALYHHVRGLVEGSKELQLDARRGQEFVDRVIAPSAQELRRWFVRGMSGYSVVASAGTMTFYLSIGIVLFVLPRWLHQPPAVLTSFVVTLLYLIRPLVDMMIALPTLRQAGIALAKIRQLDCELAPATPPLAGDNPFTARSPFALELRGVQHRYPGEHDDVSFDLGPIDLAVRAGEVVFLVGGNGSGKTTLAMLLLGFYRPEAGAIVLNGQPVTDVNRDHYRQHFSAVFSDFHLFEHLFADSLCEHQRAQHESRATHYLHALRMDHKVQITDDRFSTIALSSGQRKRLALVSAYLQDRPAYLFDEWAADQDPVFKKIFYSELLPELKARGKAVIVITHDDAYFHCADRIIKLHDGKLDRSEAGATATAVYHPLHTLIA